MLMTLLLSAGVWNIKTALWSNPVNFSKSSKNVLLMQLIRVNKLAFDSESKPSMPWKTSVRALTAFSNARIISVSANDLLRCLLISSLKTASFFVCDGNQMGRTRLIRGICKLADYRESRYVVFLSAVKGERNNTRANETAKECCVCPA